MLARPIYEALPLMYLVLGALSIVFLEPALAKIGGLLLFMSGSITWVMRSNARRRDDFKTHHVQGIFLPEAYYEFFPFLLLGISVLLAAFYFNGPGIVFMILASLRGLQLIYLRSRYRHTANYAFG
ncbi:hypothetical protein DBZ36_16450 [Alginatibacterium sediminis]|uniref:Uncharacterized protein n=1 Tax=Alginatibacterium sediminis TaxID=2164068 RepID=A0A420E774_9ALTE|nr:hypothetical protein [Alginatibacterium sediminis]RKF14255.1 hypothetical protein DBZ36_16450 [Alginatibacterium sediminis]